MRVCSAWDLSWALKRAGDNARDSMLTTLSFWVQPLEGNVNYKTMTALQHLGGDMAFNTNHVVHRCDACERLLPED